MVARPLAVAVLLAAGPALAAADDATVTARDTVYEPAAVQIAVGESVVLGNAQGTHNFVFADEALPAAPAGDSDPVWDTPLRKTFTAAGTYAFHCAAHPDQMNGTVTVVAPTPTPTPTATPAPAPPGAATPALRIRALRMARGPFCARCRRPGARLRIDLSAPARVRGTVRRRGGRARALDLGTIAAGPRTVRFGRRLAAGRYTLRLRVGDLAPRELRFRLRAVR
jgi:plastocyanin